MNVCPKCGYECSDNTDYCTNCGESLGQELSSLANHSGHTSEDRVNPLQGMTKITQVGDGGTIVVDGSQKTIYDHCIYCGKPIQQSESYRCPICAQKSLCRDCFNIQKRMCKHCIDENKQRETSKKGDEKNDQSFPDVYNIVARHSGKALDVEGYSQEDGANVFQWSLHGGQNQRWTLIPAEENYYYIVAEHSDKVLDVAGISPKNGANVFQWSLLGGTNQQWKLVLSEGEYYHIIAKHSGKALDVKGFGQEDGANVFQWPLLGGTNQQWKLVPVLPNDSNEPSSTYLAKLTLNSGKSHIKARRYNDAINKLTKAIELDPQLAEAYRQRGIAYRRIKKPGSAIVDCTKAIELQPKWAEAYRNRGNAYKDKKDYGKAIADFSKAIELNPDGAETYYNRGRTYHLQHDEKRAIADLERCLELNPRREHARKLLNHIKGKGQGKSSGKEK